MIWFCLFFFALGFMIGLAAAAWVCVQGFARTLHRNGYDLVDGKVVGVDLDYQ